MLYLVLTIVLNCIVHCYSTRLPPTYPSPIHELLNNDIQLYLHNRTLTRRIDSTSNAITLRYQGPDIDNVTEENENYFNCPHDNSTHRNLFEWNDETKWTPPLPGHDQDIILPENTNILITNSSLVPSTIPYARIVVPSGSALIFKDEPIHFVTKGIDVKEGGALIAGSETCKLRSDITITLHGGNRINATNDFSIYVDSQKGIAVAGTLDIHSVRYSSTWSRLATTAHPGDEFIVLHEPVNWDIGQQLVITTTQIKDSRDWHRNEIKKIKSIRLFQSDTSDTSNVGGVMTLIQLTSPLQYRHAGGFDYQAEVGLLSRRFIIQGDMESEPYDTSPKQCFDSTYKSGYPCPDTYITGYGGHVKVYGSTSIGRVSGVEFYRMGQTNVLGRYPFHFHLIGNGTESYIEDSSIWHSFYRCVSVHGTNSTRISRNVAYDVIGHCYYLEDGVEEMNTFEYNLAALVHFMKYPPRSNNQYLYDIPSDSETLLIPVDVTASGFYISNAYNRFIGNAASGGYSGFSFPILKRPIGPHSTSHPLFLPSVKPTLEFDGNSCHSSGYWWGSAACIYIGGDLWLPDPYNDAALVYNPGRSIGTRKTQLHDFVSRCDGKVKLACDAWMRFTNNKIFLVNNIGLKHWGVRPEIIGLDVSDFGVVSANVFGQAFMNKMFVTCRTPEYHHLEWHEVENKGLSYAEKRIRYDSYAGFEWYDTGQRHIVTNSTFKNCGNEANSYVWRTLSHSDVFVPEFMSATKNIRYINCDNGSLATLKKGDLDTVAARLASQLDADGTATLRNVPTIMGSIIGSPTWWKADEHCIRRDDWYFFLCDKIRNRQIGSFFLDAYFSQTSTSEYCETGCPTVGYLNHFGSTGAVEDGLKLTFNKKITGIIGGFGWYLSYKAGAPKRMEIYKAQLPDIGRNGSVILAVTYPPDTTFDIHAKWCSSSSKVCDHTLEKATSFDAFNKSYGSSYYFDSQTNNLYLMITSQLNPFHEYGQMETYAFVRDGVAIPLSSGGSSKLTIEAHCNAFVDTYGDSFCSISEPLQIPKIGCPSGYKPKGIDSCELLPTDEEEELELSGAVQPFASRMVFTLSVILMRSSIC